MQLLLQVLNKDLAGEAAKVSTTPDTPVLPEGEDAFASFLENPEGSDAPEVTLTLDVETSELATPAKIASEDRFRPIGQFLPSVVGEALRQIVPSGVDGAVKGDPDPSDATRVVQKLAPQAGAEDAVTVPTDLGPAVAKVEVSTDSLRPIAKDLPLVGDRKSNDHGERSQVAHGLQLSKSVIEEAQKTITEKPIPLTPRPVPDADEVTSPSPQFEKPTRIVSRELVLEPGASDTDNKQRERPSTPPIQSVLDVPTNTQHAVSAAEPLENGTKDLTVQNTARDGQLLPKDIAPEVAVKIIPPTAPAPNDRSNRNREGRSTAHGLSSETTVTVTATKRGAEATQTNQGVAFLNPAALRNDVPSGLETPLFKEDGPVQGHLTERSEVGRSSDAPVPRIETAARPVITQLVHAAKTAVDGVIEVKLSPEELGRVRLVMTTGEAGMTVLVTAERPETLDLLRRNIDQFATDLAEQGFTDLSFSFSDDTTEDQQRDFSERGSDEAEVFLPPLTADRWDANSIPSDGRLDLRL